MYDSGQIKTLTIYDKRFAIRIYDSYLYKDAFETCEEIVILRP
jgi:hypothetical protein